MRLGVILFGAGLLVCLSGFALVQLEDMPQLPTGSVGRAVVYWLHLVLPAGAVWAYIAHRKAGPRIKWRLAKAWGLGVGLFTVGMVAMHAQDPQKWFREGPKEGAQYFEPAMTRTADGKFISADVMMMDEYCAKCHADVANDHFHSAHKFSSFNNPAYLFSVRETRKVGMEKVGNVKSSRWCAGCHDPVPFLSGAFDDPNFDDVNDKTAHAGITCTVCHAMTHVNGTFGNGAYTLEEPAHYPFAQSTNGTLQWMNQQLVKAKPDFHKQTFLKPFHKTAEFCATCHKVSLPVELNHYKEFLRGQNHYDTFLLSGVSGHGVRSFYYPPQAKENCAVVPHAAEAERRLRREGLRQQRRAEGPQPPLPGANTGLFSLLKDDPRFSQHAEGFQQTIDLHANYLKGTAPDGSDKKVRIDIFGLKPDAGGVGATAPRTAGAPAGQVLRRRSRGTDARLRPPVLAGHGRFERNLGGLPRDRRRRGDRAERRAREPGRHRPGRSVVALHQRPHARPRRQPHQPPQPAGHLHAAVRQADRSRRGRRDALPARRARERHGPGGTDRAACATASSTTST